MPFGHEAFWVAIEAGHDPQRLQNFRGIDIAIRDTRSLIAVMLHPLVCRHHQDTWNCNMVRLFEDKSNHATDVCGLNEFLYVE